MQPPSADEILALARSTPVDALPRFIGLLAEASATCMSRMLAPAPAPVSDTPQLIDRKAAAELLGISRFYLEGKRLPCETRIGKKVLYNRQQLQRYIERGHIPFADR